MTVTILFVSENNDKYLELKSYLDKTDYKNNINLVKIKPHEDIEEIQSLDRNKIIFRKLLDSYQSIKEIIQHTYNNNEIYLMVEDTSLCIDKQCGLPGPFIKFYLKLQSLSKISYDNWGSPTQSIVTLGICKINKSGLIHSQHIFEGLINGVIVKEQGENGFGFDPIFKPNGSSCTNASMSINEKAIYNPRIKAFQQVLSFILPSL